MRLEGEGRAFPPQASWILLGSAFPIRPGIHPRQSSPAPVTGGFGGHRTANDRRRSAWGRPCVHPVARHGSRTSPRQAHRDPGELKPGTPRGWRHPLHARPGDRAWTNVRSDRASRLRLFRAAREFRTGTEILDAPCRDDKRPRGAWDHASGQRKLATYTSRRAFRAPRPPVFREGSYSITDGEGRSG